MTSPNNTILEEFRELSNRWDIACSKNLCLECKHGQRFHITQDYSSIFPHRCLFVLEIQSPIYVIGKPETYVRCNCPKFVPSFSQLSLLELFDP